MTTLSRRSVLRNSLAVAAAGTLARPYIANAAATTAEVWWVQGFVPEEDVAFKKVVADYEKASGNKIDLSIIPFAPGRQKIVAAMTSGIVPDMFTNNPAEITAIYAWDDKLVDVTDVVETQKEEYTETSLLNTYCYNSVAKKRSFYGVPYTTATLPNHVWRPLVEKAGYKMEDIPKTWDAYYDFFKEVQKQLKGQGVRNVYGLGLNVTTNGNDPNNVFNYFLIAYGGEGIVTKDGKLHLDDPKVREAAIKADLPGDRVYARICASGGNQLERRRRQQRLPRQADRHGSRRHDLDRGRSAVTRQEGRLRRHRYDGSGAEQRRQAGAGPGEQCHRPDPEGRKERRGDEGVSEIFYPTEG